MSSENIWCVGVDDGYAETKVVLPDGTTYRMPSQAKAGTLKQISIKGEDVDGYAYVTESGPFVVGDLRECDPTESNEYPVSPMNRAIVTHALRQAGVPGGAELYLVSGLPVKSYYTRGNLNKKLISAKRDNLLKNDVVSADGADLATVVKHEVLSEGIAAWMDYVLQRDNGVLVVNPELAAKRTAIIDIGGRTTDIAVVQDHKLDMSRSNTINVGMLMVRHQVEADIAESFDIDPCVEQINEVLKTGHIKLYGKMESVEDILAAARQTAVLRIRSEVKRTLSQASDIDDVIFVGGTVAAFADDIQGWFPNQRIGTDPAFANSRGMMKYAQYVQSKQG